nr:putative reverse transcriptase domain-containing protein [Tanacetum cinerariifolium]
MEVDIEKDKSEPELTYPYEDVDPLNPPLPTSESEPTDAIKVENPIEHEDETVPASVHKKGKAKDKYYGKLILYLGNEMHSSVKQGMIAMENLVERLGNAEDKAECKKLKKELEEERFSNRFLRMQKKRVERDHCWTRVQDHDFHQEIIRRGFMFEEKPNEAINVLIEDEKSPSSEIMPPKSSPLTYAAIHRIIKENVDATIVDEPAKHANVGNDARGSGPARANLNEAVRMAQMLMDQKSQARDERISEGKKRKWESFQSRNSSSKGNQTDNLRQTLQNNQKLGNVRAMVTAPTDGKLPLCEQCFTRHVEEVREVRGRAYVIKDDEPKGPDVVTSTFYRYAVILFDSGSERSFMDTRFISMLDIDTVKLGASYEVELVDGRVVSMNTVLKGCTLNLVNHIFEIDLMPIELGTFDVIIGISSHHLSVLLDLNGYEVIVLGWYLHLASEPR